VVTTLARLGRELGLISITFNFRGVGGSEGVYAQGLGEQDDLRAVIAWAKTQTPHLPVWLAGFSFGAYVSAAVAAQEAPACLISICPPVDRFGYATITRPACPWYIVQTEDDEVVDAKAVIAWAKTLKPEPTLITLPTGGHFFHGQLLTLRDKLSTVLLSQFSYLCLTIS
jgi:alpha/beta superfamily hydrolase